MYSDIVDILFSC